MHENCAQFIKRKNHKNRHSSLFSPKQLTLEDISPNWALRLKKENSPTFMSSTWLQWCSELRKISKCVVGEVLTEEQNTERYKKYRSKNCLGYDEKPSLVHIDGHVSPFSSILFSAS